MDKNRPTAQEIIERFALSPLTGEGGLYRRTYASLLVFAGKRYGAEYADDVEKELCSAIQYMITPETWSRLHMLKTDEIYHFYLGDPVELLLIPPEGAPKCVTLGQRVLDGMEVQYTVPAGWWQGSRLAEGGEWALLGTTMAPAYTQNDYRDDVPSELLERWPEHAEIIKKYIP